MKFGFTPEAEILNARLAMLGFVIAAWYLSYHWSNYSWYSVSNNMLGQLSVALQELVESR
jgi:hypothetical protein